MVLSPASGILLARSTIEGFDCHAQLSRIGRFQVLCGDVAAAVAETQTTALCEKFMVQRKQPARVKKMVWRISEAAPLGEFVDPDAVPATPAKPREEGGQGGFLMSSFELLNGTDISESPDTVPDDLFDELFPPKQDASTKPDRP
jgi:hypothetical protein